MANYQPEWQPTHFPIGTSAIFENPTQSVSLDGITWTNELVSYRVDAVINNGLGSWVIHDNSKCSGLAGRWTGESINIHYCRQIVKRGEGAIGPFIPSHQKLMIVEQHDRLFRESRYKTHPKSYYFFGFHTFVQARVIRYKLEHPQERYAYLNVDKLVEMMLAILDPIPNDGIVIMKNLQVSKKRFNRVFAQCYPHCRQAIVKERIKRAREEQAFYDDEFEYLYEEEQLEPLREEVKLSDGNVVSVVS